MPGEFNSLGNLMPWEFDAGGIRFLGEFNAGGIRCRGNSIPGNRMLQPFARTHLKVSDTKRHSKQTFDANFDEIMIAYPSNYAGG